MVVVAGIAAVPMFGLASRGVALLGTVPQGLPQLGLPPLHLADVNLLLPLGMACFLLAAVETAAIGRMFARKHGYRLDSNQELLAIAGSNLAAGLGHGFPVSGGMGLTARRSPVSTMHLVSSSTNRGTPSVLATTCANTSPGSSRPRITRPTRSAVWRCESLVSVTLATCGRPIQVGEYSGRVRHTASVGVAGTWSTRRSSSSSVEGSARCKSSTVSSRSQPLTRAQDGHPQRLQQPLRRCSGELEGSAAVSAGSRSRSG